MPFREIKVLVEQTYLVEMLDDTTTAIDGRTIEQVRREWFEEYDINRHHATRDTHRVGNGMRVVSSEISGPPDYGVISIR